MNAEDTTLLECIEEMNKTAELQCRNKNEQKKRFCCIRKTTRDTIIIIIITIL